jgi:hypothetical protein
VKSEAALPAKNHFCFVDGLSGESPIHVFRIAAERLGTMKAAIST